MMILLVVEKPALIVSSITLKRGLFSKFAFTQAMIGVES